MEKLLLIVDPQIDFITGSLPVPGAENAMEQLARYIIDTNGSYAAKIITADWHPYNHCSFQREDGQWPPHCIHDTVGAAIWPAVFEAAYSTAGPTKVLHKGTDSEREEYSIFANSVSAQEIRNIIAEKNISQIDICGIAGDICVLSTLRDGIEMFSDLRFQPLLPYSPSLDGGIALRQFIAEL